MVSDKDKIDIIAHEAKTDTIRLVMVEDRQWGDKGTLLPQLQDKFNTYFGYIVDGQFKQQYPKYVGKPILIELQTQFAPTEREQEFLDIVVRQFLQPRGILFNWRLLQAGQR